MRTSDRRLKHSVEVCLGPGDQEPFYLFGEEGFQFEAEVSQLFRRFRRLGMQNDVAGTTAPGPEYDVFRAEADRLGLFFEPLRETVSLGSLEVRTSIQAALTMWKPLVQLHPLFTELSEEPALFAFYLLEQIYFVSCAETYIGAAARAAASTPLGETLKDLKEDEKNHYEQLLAAVHISKTHFRLHDPNAGTQALVAHLFQLASTDPESFLVSLSLFETDSTDLSSVETFYSQHIGRVAYDSRAFIKHHQDDVAHGHVSLWEDYLETFPRIHSDRAGKFIADLHMTKHMIVLWYDRLIEDGKRLARVTEDEQIRIAEFLRPKPEWGSV